MENTQPLYQHLAMKLEEAIRAGHYAPGDKLPSENQLCQSFGVSRITVRQAMHGLTQKDLVSAVHGKGTFVKNPVIRHDLDRIVSFRKILQDQGLQGYTKIQSMEAMGGTVRLNLMGYAGGKPIVYYRSEFPEALGRKMHAAAVAAEQAGRAFSTYDLYQEVGQAVARVHQTLRADNADPELTERMELPRGKAVLILESDYYGPQGELLEKKIACYHSDIYSFRLHRHL